MFETEAIALTCNTLTQAVSLLFRLRLRELRQNVARLLVTFIPALDPQQVNYDCEVIDEILIQFIEEKERQLHKNNGDQISTIS